MPDTDTAALVDILANDDLTSPGDAGGRVELSAYGYRWLQRPQDLFG